jgi:penicillin-binding protein 2
MALLSRQKKLRLDPDAPAKPAKRPSRAEQVFLSRRMFLARGMVVAGFAALAAKLGFMQVLQHRAWAEEARSNTRRRQYLKPARGLIYDRRGRLLADNRRTWEVRVVPADLPEDALERRAVLDHLINALALPDALVLDPAAIPAGQEEVVYGALVGTMVSMGMAQEGEIDGWLEYLRLESTRNYLVLIDDALSANEAAQFRAIGAQLPGVYVMNDLDYAIGNLGDPRLAVPIKTGIPKELALRLEANKLYLPGVQVVDNVLVRRYHGGEVMSHVLGYARRMTADLYELHKNDVYDDGTTVPVYEPDDTIGQDGLEYSQEKHLRGIKGLRWIEVDSHGVERREIDRTEPIPGHSTKLTLDLELQQAISRILAEAIGFTNEDRPRKNRRFKFPANAGAVVAIDPRDGAVLATVSYPHYDNQLFVDGISERQYKQYLGNPNPQPSEPPSDAPLFNRAIAAEHPCGSTIKPFMTISGLKNRKLAVDMRFSCSGAIFVPTDFDESKGETYPCWAWKGGGHGALDVYGAIEQSCDIFFYNVGTPREKLEGATDYLRYYDYDLKTEREGGNPPFGEMHYFQGLGIEAIHEDFTERFWFGRSTEIELPGEKLGVVPNDAWIQDAYAGQRWSAGDTINVSIGQGYFQATPLQMALNTAAIANFGKVWRPRLVEALLDLDGNEVQRFEPDLLRRMKVQREHFDIAREGMRRVVHSPDSAAHHWVDPVTFEELGTKWPNLNPEDEEEIVVGGKTGTAEVGAVLEDGTYDRQHAWFTCFAPFDEPEIALAIVIEEGGEGSDYAVPVADKVLRAYFESTGRRPRGRILPADETEPEAASTPAPAAVPSPE